MKRTGPIAIGTAERRVPLRRKGLTLIELLIALSIFAILILSFSLTLMKGIEHGQESFQIYRGMTAIRDLLAEIQQNANTPQNLATGVGIGAIYSRYNGKSFAVPELQSGQIRVTCFGNETTVPPILGGPQDLNMDGDPQDNLENLSNGTDLKMVPLELLLSFVEDGRPMTIVVYRLMGKTTD